MLFKPAALKIKTGSIETSAHYADESTYKQWPLKMLISAEVWNDCDAIFNSVIREHKEHAVTTCQRMTELDWIGLFRTHGKLARGNVNRNKKVTKEKSRKRMS